MPNNVTFKHKRLWVGYRKSDFNDVWYEPTGTPDDDDKPPGMLLFSHNRGPARPQEPFPGEVAWDPLFDLSTSASTNPGEKKVLQARMLWDTYRYMSSKDAGEVEEMEAQLAAGDPKRQALLRIAESIKKAQLGAADKQRKRRATAAARGQPYSSVENSDSDSDAYEEETYASRQATPAGRMSLGGSMQPPPTPPRRSFEFGVNRRPAAPLRNDTRRSDSRVTSRGDSRARTASDDYERDPIGELPSPNNPLYGHPARLRTLRAGMKRNRDSNDDVQQDGRSRPEGTGESGRRLGSTPNSFAAFNAQATQIKQPYPREESIVLDDDGDDDGYEWQDIDFDNGEGTEEQQIAEALRRSSVVRDSGVVLQTERETRGMSGDAKAATEECD